MPPRVVFWKRRKNAFRVVVLLSEDFCRSQSHRVRCNARPVLGDSTRARTQQNQRRFATVLIRHHKKKFPKQYRNHKKQSSSLRYSVFVHVLLQTHEFYMRMIISCVKKKTRALRRFSNKNLCSRRNLKFFLRLIRTPICVPTYICIPTCVSVIYMYLYILESITANKSMWKRITYISVRPSILSISK